MSNGFADNFRRARREAGLTQQHLAKTLGVAPDTISRWARGRAAPGSAHLARLAELLNVSTDELLAAGDAVSRSAIRNRQSAICNGAVPVLGRVTAGPTATLDQPAEWREVSRLVVGDLEVIIRARKGGEA